MNQPEFDAIAANWTGDHSVRDEYSAVKYAQLPEIFGALDDFIANHASSAAYCFCLRAENDIRSVIAILYFLSRRMNFFLCPKELHNKPVIPGFCDKILSFSTAGSAWPMPGLSWNISENQEFAASEREIPLASGAVFLSSSGTTGARKYIYHKARRLQENARTCIDRFGLNKYSRVLIPVPVNHMYGFGAGLLPAVLAGANIYLMDKSNIVKLYDTLRKFMPDVTLLTPSFCKMVLLLKKKIPATGKFISAGDRIKEEYHRDFESAYGQLINLYGCTELGAIATTIADKTAPSSDNALLSPMYGVQIRIDEEDGGEIVCRHGAAFEYYVDTCGHRKEGQGTWDWFRTGDRGIAGSHGRFKILGRMDNCVNRSGFLVSLTEIETALERLFEGIAEAIVLKRDEETIMGVSIVAVIEMKQGFELNKETAGAVCREKMSRMMIPDDFFFIDKIPLLGNSKPDRVLLRKQISLIEHKNPE
jgi:acyl-coenzyme A synthetase/AMP-(fatty) acid ligase